MRFTLRTLHQIQLILYQHVRLSASSRVSLPIYFHFLKSEF
jgi:hypothetical protein